MGLADAVVAARASLSQQRYHNYVADENEPDLETLVRICAVLDTSPGQLLGVEPSPPVQTEASILRSRVTGAIEAMSLPTLRIAAVAMEAVAKEALRPATSTDMPSAIAQVRRSRRKDTHSR